MKKSLLVVGIALLGATNFAAPVRAQNVVVPVSSEAEALALLDKAAAAYAALDGLSMKYTFFNDEGGKTSRGEGEMAFEKSGRARFTSVAPPLARVVDANQASNAKSAKSALQNAITSLPAGANAPLFSFLRGQNPVRETTFFGAPEAWKGIRLLPGNGVAAALRASRMTGGVDIHWSFYLDETDDLLRHIEVKAQMKGKMYFASSTLSDIQANPQFAPDTFVAAPRASAQAATPAATAPADPDVYWDPKLKVGAAPYDLQGVDLAKFKGKVVLLDFWATWCGPCVGEMPSVLKNYAKFHPKGFEIVGISLDESKKDLTDFVKARKVPWMQVFDGKGWKGANVAQYGVKGIPFTLLVGKDGKIAAINPRGEELEPAIVAALAK